MVGVSVKRSFLDIFSHGKTLGILQMEALLWTAEELPFPISLKLSLGFANLHLLSLFSLPSLFSPYLLSFLLTFSLFSLPSLFSPYLLSFLLTFSLFSLPSPSLFSPYLLSFLLTFTFSLFSLLSSKLLKHPRMSYQNIPE